MLLKEKIVLFDMDGTLTPARQQVERDMIIALKKLSAHARIGIVTGSDYDYVLQQMSEAFEIGGVPVDRIDILPCNGTKKYTAGHDGSYQLVSKVDMIEKIGQSDYNFILQNCVQWQSDILQHYELPFTGVFFQYRGSLLNWCPIGRLASLDERSKWLQVDKSSNIRNSYCEKLTSKLSEKNIKVTVALGGTTSFDIYPTGWDKTYALKHYNDSDVWFAGDKCDPGGNDWHLYEKLSTTNRAFKVDSPQDTIRLIDHLVSSI